MARTLQLKCRQRLRPLARLWLYLAAYALAIKAAKAMIR